MMRLGACLLCCLLAACAVKPPLDEDATLSVLDGEKARIEPLPAPALDWQDVQRDYLKLLNSTDNKKLKAMALQRLGDIALESAQQQIEFEESGQRLIDDPAAWNLAASRETPETGPEIRRAIRYYEQLLALDPDYVGNARVLYQLAWAYEFTGALDKSLAALTRLHERYPGEPFSDEVGFRRGEHLFMLREYPQAELAYQGVLALGERGEFYERALFKHGWSVYKQGDMKRALDSFFRLLDRNFARHQDLAEFSRSEREVLDDTLRIISVSFAYLEGSESIDAFFQRYGQRAYEDKVYERLAELYLSQERIEDATRTYREFAGRYPLHEESPRFLTRVVDIYQQARQPEQMLAAKADFIARFGISTPFWQEADDAAHALVGEQLKTHLKDLSSFHHARAQRAKSAADYQTAAQWYRHYVQWFPDDGQAARMNFLLAEALQDGGDAQAAALEFEKTAYQYPRHEQSAEAAYAALLAYRQQLAGLQDEAREQKQREIIASGQRFTTFFPTDRRVATVKTGVAEELMHLKLYPQAAAMATQVINQQPKPAPAMLLSNWGIVAYSEFEAGNYAEAEAATLKLLELLPRDDKQQRTHLDRLAAAVYKQGEQALAAGDKRAAAQHFLRVGQRAPDAGIRAQADFDAAMAYVANEDWELAIPVLQAFTARYPRHALRPQAEEKLALLYEKQGDWLKSAGAYEVLYANATDKEKKRLLAWQVADYYQKANQPSEAVNAFKRYVKEYPQPYDDAMEAHQRLADLYQSQGKIAERHWWLEQIMRVDKRGPATARSHTLAAQGALELARFKAEEYDKVRLILPLQKNLSKKKTLMQDSLKAYTTAADYGIEAVTTEATYRIGELYRSFSRALLDSERPKELSKDELEQYDILLEEQAFPFEEKAIEAHAVNATRAKTGVYDDWVKRSFSALAGLNPARYAKEERSESVYETLQ